MADTTFIELHCHSNLSDGTLPPEQVAQRLAAAGVAFAALTDHDTIDGLRAFREVLARRPGGGREVGFITGVEITTFLAGKEVHLLAYGFTPEHAELQATLLALRQERSLSSGESLESIAHSLRNRGSPGDGGASGTADTPGSAAVAGRIDTVQAIALVHRAGGLAILAHPLVTEPDLVRLEAMVEHLKAWGLDGIEAHYGGFTPEQRERLCALAGQRGLLVSGGTDYHGPGARGLTERTPGILVPAESWKPLRDALSERVGHGGAGESPRHQAHRQSRRQFVFHIVVPTLLAIALFAAVIFGYLLPALERSLMDRKREMIRELTNSAWSILNEAHRQEREGTLTRQEAQALAQSRIETLRYGREGKDYFWLQDLTPRMLMHPYRRDLNGQDVSDFRDPRGVRIFVEFVEVVRRRNEGYVNYVWQWKDDPRRLEPKESYVRGFEPWGWIIGTGIYIDDVKEEIARIEKNLVRTSLGITAAVVLLLLYVMRESLRLETGRRHAEDDLHETTERYRSLVEAATEGTLLVLEGRCRYANPTLLSIVGCTLPQLEMLDLSDLVPTRGSGGEGQGWGVNEAVWENVQRLERGEEISQGMEAMLRRRDGKPVDCVVALSRIRYAGREGFILLVRPLGAGGGRGATRGGGELLQTMLDLSADVPEGPGAARQIALAADNAAVTRACQRAFGMARTLVKAGAHPQMVGNFLTAVCDAAMVRLATLTQNELGPAPGGCGIALLALGSHGRRQLTLASDQDNALIYADDAPPVVADYCAALSEAVCTGFNQAGFAYCPGGAMAKNPRWRLPLSAWKRNFSAWIGTAEPQEILKFTIFFDFRVVWGDATLGAELRRHIHDTLRDHPAFLGYFASDALAFKPPLRLFGRIVGSPGTAEHPDLLDLKQVMIPLVSFARLYALRHNLEETHTLHRLNALVKQNLLAASTRDEVTAAWEFLMRLRLRHQAEAIDAGLPPGNLVNPRKLSHIEEVVLRQCFTQIDAIQKKINYDFLGGT